MAVFVKAKKNFSEEIGIFKTAYKSCSTSGHTFWINPYQNNWLSGSSRFNDSSGNKDSRPR